MPVDLARLEALLAGASPRPWASEPNAPAGYEVTIWSDEGCLLAATTHERIAALIVGLVNAAPDLLALAREAEALRRFKDFVHDYLDLHSVPYHPSGPHGAEGCRIGDRLDWLLHQISALRAENEALRAGLEEVARLADERQYGSVARLARRVLAGEGENDV
jgi:hypothetical protein